MTFYLRQIGGLTAAHKKNLRALVDALNDGVEGQRLAPMLTMESKIALNHYLTGWNRDKLDCDNRTALFGPMTNNSHPFLWECHFKVCSGGWSVDLREIGIGIRYGNRCFWKFGILPKDRFLTVLFLGPSMRHQRNFSEKYGNFSEIVNVNIAYLLYTKCRMSCTGNLAGTSKNGTRQRKSAFFRESIRLRQLESDRL